MFRKNKKWLTKRHYSDVLLGCRDALDYRSCDCWVQTPTNVTSVNQHDLIAFFTENEICDAKIIPTNHSSLHNQNL